MKIKEIKKDKILIGLYVLVIFAGVLRTYFSESVETFSMPVAKKSIVIDAGHGGWNP